MGQLVRIKYGTDCTAEFLVSGVQADGGRVDSIAITFDSSVDFAAVQAFYDTNLNPDMLRRMEIYDITQVEQSVEKPADGEASTELVEVETLQGVHIGYTKPFEISCFGGVIKVKIERELAVESKVALQQETIDQLLLDSLGGM